MELIGRNFYEALAGASDDDRVRQFCTMAARDEARHYGTFKKMRDQWLQRTQAPPPEFDRSAGLAALARDRIQPDPRDVHKVAVGGNLADALKLACEMEADAIQFYGEMALHLPDAGKAIQAIVEEEKRHLAGLRVMAL
jgi:rubrerythrin